ncbi:kelch domain-containing protein 1 isoform X4 [Antennarius striatus]
MSGTCGCSLDGDMYIFGGCDYSGQTNQIYCVSLTDSKYTWKKIIYKSGRAPSPRDKLSCWVYNGRLIYFGGYGHKLLADVDCRNRSFIIDEASWLTDIYWGWNNEVHTFDPMNASWRQPETHVRHLVFRAALPLPELPMPAAYLDVEATSAEVESWKPGGATFTAWTWNHGRGQKCMHVTERVPVSAGPEGRSWHTLTAVSDSSLFLFGGLRVDCKPMSDGWLLDVETKKWREVDHNFKNKPRLWHTACPCKDSDVIVFGGSCDYILRVDTGHCNDTLIFQMQPHPLFRICKDFIAKNVKKHEMLRSQLTLLPPSLLTAVQSRMYFYRPSNKQTN